MEPAVPLSDLFPYPPRDPAAGPDLDFAPSPGHPLEIDHFLFGGQRDWSQRTRILVASGRTGDALVLMAHVFAKWGANVDLHYLDPSGASREIAEARMAAHGLSATFHTGDVSLLPQLGTFGYVDCGGGLDRIGDSESVLKALTGVVADGGGIGVTFPAPYGRSGIVELQQALGALIPNGDPAARVATTMTLLNTLPPSNGLLRNPFLQEYLQAGEAGIQELLFQKPEQSFDVDGVFGMLERAGLSLVSFAMPGRYVPRMMFVDPDLRARADTMSYQEQAALAERLAGNLSSHTLYAVRAGSDTARVAQISAEAVPHFLNATATKLAETIWKDGAFKASVDGLAIDRRLPKEVAGLVTAVDGKRNLAEMARMLGIPGKEFLRQFNLLYQPLNNFNLMRFSARRGVSQD